MAGVDLVLAVVAALERMNLPYMLVGSFATNLYGIPRSTVDADFVLEALASPAELARALSAGFKLDPQSAFEGVTGTTRYVLRHADSDFTIELFLLSEDAHDRERFARRREALLGGRRVWVPTPEDAVITKLLWATRGGRRKDLDDALNVLAVQSGKLDLAYLRAWCDRHGTREVLERLLREAQG